MYKEIDFCDVITGLLGNNLFPVVISQNWFLVSESHWQP